MKARPQEQPGCACHPAGPDQRPKKAIKGLVVAWNVPADPHGPLEDWPYPTASSLAGYLELIDRAAPAVIPAWSPAFRTSSLGALHPLLREILAARPNCPVIPAWADWSKGVVRYGEALPGPSTEDQIRKALYDLGSAGFVLRPDSDDHLGLACLKGLKRKWLDPVVVDGFQNDRALTGGQLVAAAWRLSTWLRVHGEGPRLGIVLPPGLGATVANLGAVLAGLSVVNLNFTSGRLVNEMALKKAGITAVLTAGPVRAKARDFPWPERTLDLQDILKGFSKVSLAWRWAVGWVLPAGLLRRCLQIPRRGGEQEAALLFTSGSSGEPKGVVLTHRNLVTNVRQIESVLPVEKIRRQLACLPIFHSFGSTVTLWWPLMGGPTAITYISPLETLKLAELVEKHRIDLLLTTPTFLRSFLRKARPEQLRSVKIIVTGAEKLPADLQRTFERTFAVPVCEGYGMTEASPVVSVNLIGFGEPPGTAAYENPRRLGSVGRMVPGISVRVRHPESGEDLPLEQSGVVWLRGGNIFPGYLEDPGRTRQVLQDQWYCSGDFGHVDQDGFLFIDGRLSRFSKIAGEMVSHGLVEDQLNEVFQSIRGEGFLAAVFGIPDPAKGESLVALVNRPVGVEEARSALLSRGLASLWIPKAYHCVEEIPLLPTGKLDLKGCQQLLDRTRSTM